MATDLTLNYVIVCLNVFERVKVMLAMALIRLCFGEYSSLGYVKQKVLLIFFLLQMHYQANDSTK